MNDAGASDDAGLQPFRDWQQACARLRAAEARGDDYAEIVRLSAEVVRTRNAVTLHQFHAGWDAPDDILRHLTVDEHLLLEKDDAALSRNPAASSIPPQRTENFLDN
jgi:hypothetical protein